MPGETADSAGYDFCLLLRFFTRRISGIILVAIALAVIIPGNEVLLISTCIISLIGLFEFYRVLGIEKANLGIIGYIFTILYYLQLEFDFLKKAHNTALFIIFMIVLLIFYVISYPKFNSEKAFGAFFGFFYVAVMLSFIYLTRQMPHGEYLVWLIFLCSWGCDTCAYCVGKLFGKHKMTPVLSPHKSVEGGIGGVVGAIILTFIYLMVLQSRMHIRTLDVVLLSLSAGVGAVISMFGDLAASAIKRNYEIKDYGKIIPGHGGIMDRFDSVIITAPIIYYLATFVLERI